MPYCEEIRLEDGTVALVRFSGTRETCSRCGRQPARLLCDWPIKEGKTCDRRLCRACAVHREPDTDYCPSHDAGAEAVLEAGRLEPGPAGR